jgi:hypothetical protein
MLRSTRSTPAAHHADGRDLEAGAVKRPAVGDMQHFHDNETNVCNFGKGGGFVPSS